MKKTLLGLLIALVACSSGLGFDDTLGLGFDDTPTGRSVRTGTVTSAVDGSPLEGAKVYWSFPGFVVGDGPLLAVDTAVADAAGLYLLDTEYYCNSQLAARADGYVSVHSNLSFLDCAGASQVVDIVLSALGP